MPRYNIEYNDKWICFSSISDGFLTEFMDKSEYENWRRLQYGTSNYKPAEQCNRMNMKEAVYSIRLNRTHEEVIECLLECGLCETECEKIIYDIETEHYCPIPKENGKYECPNCHCKVNKEQRMCEVEDCCLDFVWRD